MFVHNIYTMSEICKQHADLKVATSKEFLKVELSYLLHIYYKAALRCIVSRTAYPTVK